MARKVFCIFGAVFFIMSTTVAVFGIAPQAFGFSAWQVASGSMEPNVPEGSIVYARDMAAEIGDVVLFLPEEFGEPVLHRVIGSEDGEFITKGDANNRPDVWHADAGNMIGVMVFWLRDAWIACGIGMLGLIGSITGTVLFITGVAMPDDVCERLRIRKRRRHV